jgi:hypothetical protein
MRWDSLGRYVGAAPAGSTIVMDSVDFDAYLTSANAYNLDAFDSSFDYRCYVTKVRKTVRWEEGASIYDGGSCDELDTASTTNQWVNKFTPSYPSTSRHLWAGDFGDDVADSAWSETAARSQVYDIFEPNPEDTFRINQTATPPGSWTDFPMQTSWFQDWVDGEFNNGLLFGQDSLYDSTTVEMNYRTDKDLPTNDNGMRLTLWWHYEAVSSNAGKVLKWAR